MQVSVLTSQQTTFPLLVAQSVYLDVIGESQSTSSLGGALTTLYHFLRALPLQGLPDDPGP
jgi:hypothetical protein